MSSKLLPFVSGKTTITKMAPDEKQKQVLASHSCYTNNYLYVPKKQQVAKKNMHPCIPIQITTIGKHFNKTNAVIQEKQKQTVAPIDLICEK